MPRGKYNDFISKNYRWSEKDVDKGFRQGVIACYQALAGDEECVLPKRYKEAIERLGKRTDLIITQADKGGGVVIMNKSYYIEK